MGIGMGECRERVRVNMLEGMVSAGVKSQAREQESGKGIFERGEGGS
jgi:hypothetical protein